MKPVPQKDDLGQADKGKPSTAIKGITWTKENNFRMRVWYSTIKRVFDHLRKRACSPVGQEDQRKRNRGLNVSCPEKQFCPAAKRHCTEANRSLADHAEASLNSDA
jgi:hypothetical protein